MPTLDTAPVLEIENLQVKYGQITAVWDVSVDVREGEIVAVVGPNGAGKTSLINGISGLVRAARGSIRLFDQDITRIPAHRRAAIGVAQSPEGRKLFPDMTVRENLRLGAYCCGESAEVKRRMEKAFTLFPRLRERQSQTARTLSGGEQQMVALGRAMMSAPRLLLLDEPSLGLAPKLVGEVFEAIQEIISSGTPILIVEQNVRQTLELAHRGYVLENGRIVLSGSGRELLAHERISTAYLGIQ